MSMAATSSPPSAASGIPSRCTRRPTTCRRRSGCLSGSRSVAKAIEFYWDLGSTNSYFALHLIKPLAARHGARIVPHPFNLGYVFRHYNYVLMDQPKAKIANRIVDLHRWARRYKLPFRMPSKFPIKTSPALRGALAMRRFGKEWDYLEAIFAAYWERDDASVAESDGLRPIAASLGIDPDRFLALTDSAEV